MNAPRDGKFWIEADHTPDGFALDLEAAGIPKDRIVLAFKHPELWRFSEYSKAANLMFAGTEIVRLWDASARASPKPISPKMRRFAEYSQAA